MLTARVRRTIALALFCMATFAMVAAARSASGSAAGPAPQTFVASVPAGARTNISLYSSRTGGLTRRIASFGNDFANNGFALSPDGKAVYFTRSEHETLQLLRLSVASGQTTRIAAGSEPAIDDSGSELAYAAGQQSLAVRDLKTGRVRLMRLGKLLGSSETLVGAPITWLANGTDVAIFPSLRPNVSAKPSSQRGSVCRLANGAPGLLLVRAVPAPATLSARCLRFAPALNAGVVLSGDSAAPRSVLCAYSNGRGTIIDRITATGHVTRAVAFGTTLRSPLTDPESTCSTSSAIARPRCGRRRSTSTTSRIATSSDRALSPRLSSGRRTTAPDQLPVGPPDPLPATMLTPVTFSIPAHRIVGRDGTRPG